MWMFRWTSKIFLISPCLKPASRTNSRVTRGFAFPLPEPGRLSIDPSSGPWAIVIDRPSTAWSPHRRTHTRVRHRYRGGERDRFEFRIQYISLVLNFISNNLINAHACHCTEGYCFKNDNSNGHQQRWKKKKQVKILLLFHLFLISMPFAWSLGSI